MNATPTSSAATTNAIRSPRSIVLMSSSSSTKPSPSGCLSSSSSGTTHSALEQHTAAKSSYVFSRCADEIMKSQSATDTSTASPAAKYSFRSSAWASPARTRLAHAVRLEHREHAEHALRHRQPRGGTRRTRSRDGGGVLQRRAPRRRGAPRPGSSAATSSSVRGVGAQYDGGSTRSGDCCMVAKIHGM